MHFARALSHLADLRLALRSRQDLLRRQPELNLWQAPWCRVHGPARSILCVVRRRRVRRVGRDRQELASPPSKAVLLSAARLLTFRSPRLNPRRGQGLADRVQFWYPETEPDAAEKISPLYSAAIEERPGGAAVCDGR